MNFPFEPRKAVQAAAVLLRAENQKRMSYLRLLKLLYIADRESLKTTGRPIIGNRPVAMDQGPLHSAVYDLIKGTHADEAVWSEFIQKDRYQVELITDPGVLELSRSDIEILNRVSDTFCNSNEWDLVEYTHTFDEWKKNYKEKTSSPIAVQDILAAIGLEQAEQDAIIEDLRDLIKVQQFLATRSVSTT